MLLEINYREKKNYKKKFKHMEVKQYVTKWSMDHWKNKEKIRKYLETIDNENTIIQNVTDTAKAVLNSKTEIYSNTVLPQETRKISNKLLYSYT